jgi:sec-independent protein translocase protein TatB
LAAIRVFGFGKSFEWSKHGGMHAQLAMFDFGWGELILIGIVALVAIGPKELPGALRTLGQWVAKVRRMATEFQNQFHEALREAELAELKKEVDEMASKAQSYAQFDPIEDIRKDIESAASPPPAMEAPLSVAPLSYTSDSSAPVEKSADPVSSPAVPAEPAATAVAADSGHADPAPHDADLSSGESRSGVTPPGTVEPDARRPA